MSRIFTSNSEAETAAIARQLAEEASPGAIYLLEGNLGTGKTVFAREFIRALCGDPELIVPSPTFTLVQAYDYGQAQIWHFDLYRLKAPEEIYELGWEEIGPSDIVLIEWPERLGDLKPSKFIGITLEIKDQSRIIHVKRQS